MLFALIPLKAGLRQLPPGNGIILRLTEITTVNNSIGTYFGNGYDMCREVIGSRIRYLHRSPGTPRLFHCMTYPRNFPSCIPGK